MYNNIALTLLLFPRRDRLHPINEYVHTLSSTLSMCFMCATTPMLITIYCILYIYIKSIHFSSFVFLFFVVDEGI